MVFLKMLEIFLITSSFDKEISKMANNDALFAVIQEFNSQKAYLGADTVTSTDYGLHL